MKLQKAPPIRSEKAARKPRGTPCPPGCDGAGGVANRYPLTAKLQKACGLYAAAVALPYRVQRCSGAVSGFGRGICRPRGNVHLRGLYPGYLGLFEDQGTEQLATNCRNGAAGGVCAKFARPGPDWPLSRLWTTAPGGAFYSAKVADLENRGRVICRTSCRKLR